MDIAIGENEEKYCVVRGQSSGAFAGRVVFDPATKTAKIRDCRRLWFWSGAASLSELALLGVANPDRCKFPAPTPEHYVLDVIEVIPCSEKGRRSIEGVPVWSAK